MNDTLADALACVLVGVFMALIVLMWTGAIG